MEERKKKRSKISKRKTTISFGDFQRKKTINFFCIFPKIESKKSSENENFSENLRWTKVENYLKIFDAKKERLMFSLFFKTQKNHQKNHDEKHQNFLKFLAK